MAKVRNVWDDQALGIYATWFFIPLVFSIALGFVGACVRSICRVCQEGSKQ